MTNTTKTLGLIGLILILGGGFYIYSHRAPKPAPSKTELLTNSSPKAPSNKEGTSNPTTNVNQNEKTNSEAATKTNPDIKLPAIDDTWKTYTNKSGDFSFQWPTKGRYAPKWDSSFADTDPCTEGETKVLNSNTFCHQTSILRSDNVILTHMYTIPFGKKFIVMSFSKETSQAGFDEATFDAHLDQIMSTFAFKK
ncbi:hypothetical protein IT408_04245 [Candidatus Uhrbacteria bacterium]|nr:hypothetical protein [Candidatus Uhrbacteria bacterium]